MRGSDARSDLALVGDKFPVEGITILFGDIALIGSRSFNITSEDEEALIVNLRQGVIISGLWNISRLLHLTPRTFISVKFKCVLAVFEIVLATEHDDTVAKDSRFVMRDFGRNVLALLSYGFPSNPVLRIRDQFLYSANA